MGEGEERKRTRSESLMLSHEESPAWGREKNSSMPHQWESIPRGVGQAPEYIYSEKMRLCT